MKWLGIELVGQGNDGIHVVHCTSNGRPCGGGKSMWLTTLRGYALKFNPTIDGIQKQPTKEMEAVKEAWE